MPFEVDELDHDPFGRPSTEWRSAEAVAERERWQAEAREAKRRVSSFGRIAFGELRTRKAKPPDFVVDDWMVAREVSFFAGESEAGKTFLAIDVAMRIALGWPVFGRRTKLGLVIYQIGESGDSLLDLRIPAWVHHFGGDLPESVPFVVLPSKINLWTQDDRAKDGVHALMREIADIRAEWPGLPMSALFVDTFNKAFSGGSENDQRDVARVVGNAEMIARDTGAHVPIIHHFPKGGTTLRGHGSLRADVNAVAMVTVAQDKVRTIKLNKLRDGEKRDMQFELMQVRLGEREGDGKPITSCVVLPVGEKAERRTDVANSVRLSTNELGLFQAFWRALEQFGGSPHPSLDCPTSVRVAPYDEVRRIFVDASPMQDAETYETEEAREDARRRHVDRLRKQMQRACGDLIRKWKVINLGQAPDPDTGKPVHYAWWTGRPVRDMPQTYPPKPKQAADNVDAVIAEGGDWISEIM